MPKRYFDLADDVYIPGRWEFGKLVDHEGKDIWPWPLMRGAPAHIEGRLYVPINIPGMPLDFSQAVSAIPIVHAKVASVLMELAPGDVQLFPVVIDGQSDQYFVLNATRLIRCIDDHRSEEVQYWTPEDGLPEKVGTYSSVSGMRIDPMKVGDAKVFRTWGWTIALIVSEEIKQAMEHVGATGARFKEV